MEIQGKQTWIDLLRTDLSSELSGYLNSERCDWKDRILNEDIFSYEIVSQEDFPSSLALEMHKIIELCKENETDYFRLF